MDQKGKRVLLTGATGYVGGRLLKALEEQNYPIRCLARRPEYLHSRVGPATEVVQGDVLDSATLDGVFDGIDTAYYMVHSMGNTGSFAGQDRQAANHFSEAAKHAGVQRIIYLGGLGDASETLSPHLRSRQEVGEILQASGILVIEFRASIVIGSGSLSFEMIRALVEKLPVMTTPKWVHVQAQPIAIADVLQYLLEALELELPEKKIFEIGGKDVVSYAALMKEYALQRHLRRLVIPVPVLTPWLSSLWLGLVTPVFARVGRKLIDSLRHPTVVRDRSADDYFSVKPIGVSDAIADSLCAEEKEFAETRWSDSLAAGGTNRQWGGVRFGTRLVDARSTEVTFSASDAFEPIRRIGGCAGWYFANALWKVRGFIDLLVGGVGMRRGRRHPTEIRVGDVIDWWRVEDYEPGRRLRLVAEMKLPGRAWLEFEVKEECGHVVIYQVAIFDPIGLSGLLYWYGIWPLHQFVFHGMLQRIVQRGALIANGQDPMLCRPNRFAG